MTVQDLGSLQRVLRVVEQDYSFVIEATIQFPSYKSNQTFE